MTEGDTAARPPLRIGIDARAASEEPAGRGRVVRELLRHLTRLDRDHRYLLYARERWTAAELDGRFDWRLIEAPDALWHLRAAQGANRECDVYLSTNSYLTVWFLRRPSVALVFDMITFDKRLRPQRRASLIERATLRPAIHRAHALVAISEATRDDLVARYPEAAAKTDVVPLAAEETFTPDRDGAEPVAPSYGIARPFVLAAGTLEPRKNLERLIEAFTGLPAELRERYELVLVGATGWEAGPILERVAAHAGSVRRLGYVPEEHLAALYREAELFCYPSLYEGFGLPVLEAMQSGTAVITSAVSSLPEVGGEAVRYVQPLEVADIRAALEELLADPGRRGELAALGLERARRFSWELTAKRLLETLERASGRTPEPAD